MKSILFNTEMVRAILDGRKTVTRRVVKPQPTGRLVPELPNSCWPGYFGEENTPRVVRPPYFVGDILYVRETWCDPSGTGYPFLYKADMPMHWDGKDTEIGVPIDLKAEDYTWRPSIHMPKEAARIFLRVTAVRVKQLKEVTETGAKAEGFGSRQGFLDAIRKMYPDTTEESWFWVVEFERITKEEAEHG